MLKERSVPLDLPLRRAIDSRRLTALSLAILAITWTATPFLKNAHSAHGHLAYLTDDAFYYLKIANNIAHGQGSTFNGIVPTNGYHPLWMVVMVGLCHLADPTSLAFFGLLTALSLVALCVSTQLVWRLLSSFGYRNHGSKLFGAGLFFAVFLRDAAGMENILVIPFLLAFLVHLTRFPKDPSWQRAFFVGMFGILATFSRLDSVLLVLFSTAVFVASYAKELPRAALGRLLAAVGMGCALLIPYVVFNRLAFGAPLPISGHAKQLRDALGFSSRPLASLLSRHGSGFDYIHPTCTFLLAPLIGVWALVRARDWLRTERAVVLALVGFSLAYYGLLSWLSDWPLWKWYYYPLLILAPIALCKFHHALANRAPWLASLALLVLLGGLNAFSLSRFYRRQPQDNAIYAAGVQIAEFANQHPGIYAMGDRAGTPGFLMTQPLIQMEGLVSDPWLLAAIRRHADVHEIFGHYQVDYYVGTQLRSSGDCFRVVEPEIAGAMAPHAQGRICDKPVHSFELDGIKTTIFRVAPALRAEFSPNRH